MEYTNERLAKLQELFLQESGTDLCLTEAIAALAEITRLQDMRRWHQYDEGDTSAFPPYDDWFWIIYQTETEEKTDLEFYSIEDGWSTDKKIIGWAYQPEHVEPLPPAPKRGE